MRLIDEVDGTATPVQQRLCATSTTTVADVDRSGAWDRTTDLEFMSLARYLLEYVAPIITI